MRSKVETPRGGKVPVGSIGRTSKGGNTHKMTRVGGDNPRTPKEGRHSGLNTARRRAQDGTRANRG